MFKKTLSGIFLLLLIPVAVAYADGERVLTIVYSGNVIGNILPCEH